MDILISFLFIIIATIIGITIGIFLDIKSYLKIAIIILCFFIPMELYNKLIICKCKNSISTKANILVGNSNVTDSNIITTSGNTITTVPNIANNITDYHPEKDDSNAKFARQKQLDDTKYSIFKKTDSEQNTKNSLPLDGLSPKDLITSLNYITYSTANPYKPLSYNNYKTHADKYLDQDGTKLSTNDIKLQAFSKAHYPQLTEDQIDTRDCLNFGSGKNSCFQSAQLFNNVKNQFGILGNGVNEDNSNLIIKEDFTNPMILNPDTRYQQVLFKNAIDSNLDKIIDNESNETINLDNSNNTCRNCKLSICKDDYCGLQNQLFM